MKIPNLEGDIVCLRSVEPEKDYTEWYEVMKNPDMHRWTGIQSRKIVMKLKSCYTLIKI